MVVVSHLFLFIRKNFRGHCDWIGHNAPCLRLSISRQPRILFLLVYPCNFPSPPISAVISSIRSSGNGGEHSGFMAMDISFIGLSSAATRLELNAPHLLQRWMIAHSPFFLTHTATGSIILPQSDSRSPGS